MDLNTQVESVESREDLVRFIEALRRDLVQNPDEWENPTLDRFLDALSAWVRSMDGYYVNLGLQVPCSPSWKTVAEMMIAAKIYE